MARRPGFLHVSQLEERLYLSVASSLKMNFKTRRRKKTGVWRPAVLASNPGCATWGFYFGCFVSLFRLLFEGRGGCKPLPGRGAQRRRQRSPRRCPCGGQTECLGAARGASMSVSVDSEGQVYLGAHVPQGAPFPARPNGHKSLGNASGSEDTAQPGQCWLTQWHLGA